MGKPMFLFLQPRHVAKRCFLWEAVLYRCVQKVPLEPPKPLDRNACSTIVPDYLSFNAERETLLRADDCLELIHGRADEEAPSERSPREAERDRAIEIHRAQCDLFYALTDARLAARGRQFDKTGLLEQNAARNLLTDEVPLNSFEAIPADFWRLNKINWFESLAVGESQAFCHIQVDCGELTQIFPPQRGQPVPGLRLVGDALLISANQLEEPLSKSQAGRSLRSRGRPPKFDWKAIVDEAVQRLTETQSPVTVDWLVNELIYWCEREGWKEAPKYSAVYNYVSPLVKLRNQLSRREGSNL